MNAPLKPGGKGLELRPSIALQKKMSMEDALEFNFPNFQHILYALVGSLVTLAAEGKILLQDQNVETLRTGTWTLVSPIDTILSNMHHATAHRLVQLSLLCGTHAMSDATGKFTTRWENNRMPCGTATSKVGNSKFFDREFHVFAAETSMQLLEAIKQHVSSTGHPIGKVNGSRVGEPVVCVLLFASLKYMDDLPEETLDFADETNSTKMKIV